MFVDAQRNQANAATLTVTAPFGMTNKGALVAWKCCDSAGNTFTWPSGFTDITGSPFTQTGVAQLGVAVKPVDIAANEPASYDLTTTNTGIGGVAFYAGRNGVVNQVSSAVDAGAASSPWSAVAPTMTTTVDGCDLIVISYDVLSSNSGNVEHTLPALWNNRDDATGTNNAYVNYVMADLYQGSQGATGSVTVIGTYAANTSQWIIALLALERSSSQLGKVINYTGFPKPKLKQAA